MNASYRCEWREPFYKADESVVSLYWFDGERGYDDNEIMQIQALAVGQSIEIGIGGHRVTRIS